MVLRILRWMEGFRKQSAHKSPGRLLRLFKENPPVTSQIYMKNPVCEIACSVVLESWPNCHPALFVTVPASLASRDLASLSSCRESPPRLTRLKFCKNLVPHLEYWTSNSGFTYIPSPFSTLVAFLAPPSFSSFSCFRWWTGSRGQKAASPDWMFWRWWFSLGAERRASLDQVSRKVGERTPN